MYCLFKESIWNVTKSIRACQMPQIIFSLHIDLLSSRNIPESKHSSAFRVFESILINLFRLNLEILIIYSTWNITDVDHNDNKTEEYFNIFTFGILIYYFLWEIVSSCLICQLQTQKILVQLVQLVPRNRFGKIDLIRHTINGFFNYHFRYFPGNFVQCFRSFFVFIMIGILSQKRKNIYHTVDKWWLYKLTELSGSVSIIRFNGILSTTSNNLSSSSSLMSSISL